MFDEAIDLDGTMRLITQVPALKHNEQGAEDSFVVIRDNKMIQMA